MNKKSTEIRDIEEIAQQAQAGEDVSEHFTNRFQAKQRVSVSLPVEVLRRMDAQCQLQGMSREEWIRMACVEKLRELEGGDTKIPLR